MSNYEMELAIKNAIIEVLKEKYNEEFTIDKIQIVWFCKTLQNFKAMVIDRGENNRYYEASYNGNKKELYIDVYEKQSNTVITNLNTKVEGEESNE